MYSNYALFGSGLLPLLALDEPMLRDLASLTIERERGQETRVNRQSLHRAWEANNRHLKAISDPQVLTNYGLRKEITFRLDTVLSMWSRGCFDPDRNLHTGAVSRVLNLHPTSDEPHYPFWIVHTRDINSLIFYPSRTTRTATGPPLPGSITLAIITEWAPNAGGRPNPTDPLILHCADSKPHDGLCDKLSGLHKLPL